MKYNTTLDRTSSWVKVKVHPVTGDEGPEEEYWYRSIFSLTSVLDGGGWLTPRPGRFTPGKGTWYPLYRRLDWPQGRSGQVRKILPPSGNCFWEYQEYLLLCVILKRYETLNMRPVLFCELNSEQVVFWLPRRASGARLKSREFHRVQLTVSNVN